jgi:hypothetical protein
MKPIDNGASNIQQLPGMHSDSTSVSDVIVPAKVLHRRSRSYPRAVGAAV